MSELFNEIANLDTEKINPNTINIDVLPLRECLELINQEDTSIPSKIKDFFPQIEELINHVITAIKNSGRLFYIGAGTSGRLGVLDASECPPTFGADPDQVIGLIAGGKEAMFVAQEGAEDSEELAKKDLLNQSLNEKDVVVGLAASGRTPYVLGGINFAKQIGCKTALIATSKVDSNKVNADFIINPIVGPEVIMGSTRMKSATAQKMILNMITTLAYVKMGKTYNNIMIDLQMTNAKLKERAKRTIITVCDVTYEVAEEYLALSENHVKTAILMILSGLSKDEANVKLKESEGKIKSALNK
jgi:N-acetylmuramic acid 6-phosphate etherase